MNLSILQEMYNEAYNNRSNLDSLREFEMSKRYYDGDQLPPDVRADLEDRGQPVFFENIYVQHSNKIAGFNITSRQEIKVIGRQEDDFEIANVLTDLCRMISDKQENKLAKQDADTDLQHGLCIMEVSITELEEKDIFGKTLKQIDIEHIPTRSFLIDPLSQKKDGSDAKYFHKLIWMDKDDALLYFGDIAKRLSPAYYNSFRERVLLTVTWYQTIDLGQLKRIWKRIIWNNDLIVLDDCSAYNEHPYSIMKLEVEEKTNKWYGLFRNIRPLQDSVNFSTNRMLNMLGSTKILYEKGAVDDAESFGDEYNNDNSVTGVKDGALSGNRIKEIKLNTEITQLSGVIASHSQKADKVIGLNDEMLAAASNRMSGDAIRERIRLGMISINKFIKASDDVDICSYTKAVKLMKKYFNAEQVFEIVDRNNMRRYVAINKIVKNEDGSVSFDGGKEKRQNMLKIGAFDISITTTQATEGASAERYRQGVELLKMLQSTSRPEVVEGMVPLILRENDSPVAQDALELIEQLKQDAASSPANAQNAQVAQLVQKLQIESAQLKNEEMKGKIGQDKARTVKLIADAGAKSAKAQIDSQSIGAPSSSN